MGRAARFAVATASGATGRATCERVAHEEQLTSSAGDRDCQVPPWVLKEARGVAFLFTYKVGVFASVSGGTGVVMRRLPGSNAWGPPVASGLDFGVNKTQQLVVLRSDEAVEAFMKPSAKLSIGLNIAAGPVGRQIEEAGHISKDKAVNAFTYALTQGIFAGVSVQGMFVKEREEENRRFYGGRQASGGGTVEDSSSLPRGGHQAAECARRDCEQEVRLRLLWVRPPEPTVACHSM